MEIKSQGDSLYSTSGSHNGTENRIPFLPVLSSFTLQLNDDRKTHMSNKRLVPGDNQTLASFPE